jgi:hypothetical protein
VVAARAFSDTLNPLPLCEPSVNANGQSQNKREWEKAQTEKIHVPNIFKSQKIDKRAALAQQKG